MEKIELTLENVTEVFEKSKEYIHKQGFKDNVFKDAERIIDIVGIDGFIYITAAHLQSVYNDLDVVTKGMSVLLDFVAQMNLSEKLAKKLDHQKPFDA